MPAVINDLFVGSSWGRLLCCIREIDLSNLFTVNQWDRQGRKEQNVFISPVVLKIMVDFHVLMLLLLFSSGGHQILVNYMTDASERSLECYDESVPYWLLLSSSFRSVNQSGVITKGSQYAILLTVQLAGKHLICICVEIVFTSNMLMSDSGTATKIYVWGLKHETWLVVLF